MGSATAETVGSPQPRHNGLSHALSAFIGQVAAHGGEAEHITLELRPNAYAALLKEHRAEEAPGRMWFGTMSGTLIVKRVTHETPTPSP